jgi:hypothetical protein
MLLADHRHHQARPFEVVTDRTPVYQFVLELPSAWHGTDHRYATADRDRPWPREGAAGTDAASTTTAPLAW